jgi:hypothetical protein
MLSFSISYPYLVKFHYFADNSHSTPGEDEASNQGCNSGPRGHMTLPILYISFAKMLAKERGWIIYVCVCVCVYVCSATVHDKQQKFSAANLCKKVVALQMWKHLTIIIN